MRSWITNLLLTYTGLSYADVAKLTKDDFLVAGDGKLWIGSQPEFEGIAAVCDITKEAGKRSIFQRTTIANQTV